MKRVVVGVSGGCDSMALLHRLVTDGIEVVCVHVNYKMRDTADRDQVAVESLCTDLSVPFVVFEYDKGISGNFQKEARDFRYSAMIQVALRYECEAIAVAHHSDDVLETYLLHEHSGRKRRFLGLKERGLVMGFPVWRPLLFMTKKDLVEYCKKWELVYHDDESNRDLKYKRNEIRLSLEQYSSAQKEALYQRLQENQKSLDDYYRRVDGYIEDVKWVESYKQIPDAYRLVVLRQWLLNGGVQVHHISDKQVQSFDDKIHRGTLDDCIGYKRIRVQYGYIEIYEPISYAYTFTTIQEFSCSHFQLQFTGAMIEGLTLSDKDFPIVVRSPKKGDQITMRFGTKYVNRFFIDRKMSHNLRYSCPVVENAVKEVIFVAGLGCDMRHFSNNPSVFVIKL